MQVTLSLRFLRADVLRLQRVASNMCLPLTSSVPTLSQVQETEVISETLLIGGGGEGQGSAFRVVNCWQMASTVSDSIRGTAIKKGRGDFKSHTTLPLHELSPGGR